MPAPDPAPPATDPATDPASDRLGVLEAVGDRWRLRYVRDLSHPPERVWRALVEPDDLTAWFPHDIVGERRAGAPLRFVFRHGEAPDFDGELLTFDPPRLLELAWGDDVLRFELESTAAGTRLTFTDTIVEQGKAARDGAGWHVCLAALRAHLVGVDTTGADDPRRAWEPVQAAYVTALGPAASTIGPPPNA